MTPIICSEVHQLLGMRNRERTKHQRIDHGEDGNRCSDADREGGHKHPCEERVACERLQTVGEISVNRSHREPLGTCQFVIPPRRTYPKPVFAGVIKFYICSPKLVL